MDTHETSSALPVSSPAKLVSYIGLASTIKVPQYSSSLGASDCKSAYATRPWKPWSLLQCPCVETWVNLWSPELAPNHLELLLYWLQQFELLSGPVWIVYQGFLHQSFPLQLQVLWLMVLGLLHGHPTVHRLLPKKTTLQSRQAHLRQIYLNAL